MSKLSMGLSGLKKPSLTSRPPPAKRKPVFSNENSDSEDDQIAVNPTSTFENITTLDSDSAKPSSKPFVSKSPSSSSKVKLDGPPAPPKRALHKPTTAENISSTYTSNKHAQQAEELDPSIYDYDGIYDAMKAPPSSSTNTDDGGDGGAGGKRKYMSALKAAAEVRKRDYIRAQDRKTAREREAEGEEFKDKESFVTGAYKRQQEEMRQLEEEEKANEAEEDAKRKSGGGGMKKFYTNLLDRDEERHRAAMEAVEENKGKVSSRPEDEAKKEKTEADIAKEKGVTLNEEGEVVDKRELLKAGLNAGSAAKVKKPTVKPSSGAREGETQRERETREFEEQLLGKHGLSSDDDGHDDAGLDVRASKSRKMEEELLKGFESP